MATPARRARSSTVATSQRSDSPSVPSIVRAPHAIFAIGFESKSEMNAPTMP